MKTQPNARVATLFVFSAACLILLLTAFLKQRAELARVKKAYEQFQEQQRAAPQNNTASRRAEAGPPAVAPAAPLQAPVSAKPKAHPPEEAPNRLALAGTEVTSTPGGLVATMRFIPSKTGPLGLLALAVRMPRNAGVRILGVAPVGSAAFSDYSKDVSGDGAFAFFQGTLGDEKEVQVALSVSGPTTVYVSGSCGIKPFELAIQAPLKNGRKP